jgi:hypothetical protein
MNSRQKEILRTQLNNEEQTLKELKQVYSQALKDCESRIQELSMRADLEPENIKSIIYQKQYQEAIKAQLEGALANLQSNSYATVSDYLTRSYQEGYLGTMYDLQGRGIPLVMPIDQEQVAQAIQLNTKLSTSLYNRMGEDVKVLKKAVKQEVSRGIAQGMTWSQVASNLAGNMKHTPFQKAYNNSIRIARTEGHRIQNNATLDAQKNAKDRGADIVKRWNAVLDGKTRDVHRELDGQVREIGEMFEAAGYKVEAPGMFGDPSQDCNCRCYLEQVPRWDLEGGMTKMDNFSKRIVAFETPNDYEEWKKAYWSDENIAYMNYVTDMEKKYGKNFETVLNSMTDKEYEKYKRLLGDNPMYKSKNPLVKVGKNAKIKNIELPPEADNIKGISGHTKKAICDSFDKIKENYNVRINIITVMDLGRQNEKVPFQFVPENVGGYLRYKLVLNAGYDFNGSLENFTARIMRNYNNGVLASKNVEDLLAHEMAHILTFQDCDTFGTFLRLEEEVRESFIRGVSAYADSTYDGAETIAEAFVRYRRGEHLSEDVMALLQKYVLKKE